MLRLSLWSVVTNLSQEESFYLSKERGHVSLGLGPGHSFSGGLGKYEIRKYGRPEKVGNTEIRKHGRPGKVGNTEYRKMPYFGSQK